MATRQVVIAQEDFSAGMYRNMAPHLIPQNAAWDIRNGLLNDEGSIYRRGGTVNKSGAAFGSGGLTFLWDGYTDAGLRTLFANASDFGVLDSDDSTVVNLGSDGLSVPRTAAFVGGSLFIGGGYIYGGSRKTATYSTGTVTKTQGSKTITGSGTSWLTNLDTGMLFQFGSERVYQIASVDSNTQLTLRDAYQGSTAAGAAYTAHHIYVIDSVNDPYIDGNVYGAVANRAVVLNHAIGNEVRAYFSNVGSPHVYGATDYHTFPWGGRGLGLATLGQTLFVFITTGIWSIDGMAYDLVDDDGNTQHRVEQVAPDLVLWGQPGIASYGQTLVVPCVEGIFLFDGISRPQRISAPIEDYYRDYVEAGYTPGRAAVYRSHYFLPILSGTSWVDTLVCRLDAATPAWTRFDDNGGRIAAYAVRQPESAEPILLGAEADASSRVVNASDYFEPEAANKNDADGTTHEFRVTTRDYPTGSNTKNSVRFVRTRYELEDASTDDPQLDIDYGTGARVFGAAEWGLGEWGVGFGPEVNGSLQPWGSVESAELADLGCPAPEDPTGTTLHRCRVNSNTRHVRYRYRCNDPAAKLVLRSVESFIRPSRALRR